MNNSAYAAIALDLGTTSIKAGLLDHAGVLSHVVSHPAARLSVDGGRYESDASEYVRIARQVLEACRAQSGDAASRVVNLGVCSQRSSFLIWEADTGQPVTPLISWQDDRGASSCSALQAEQSLSESSPACRWHPIILHPSCITCCSSIRLGLPG